MKRRHITLLLVVIAFVIAVPVLAQDVTDPQVVSLSPADDNNNADPAANLTIQFDENVQAGTGNITLFSGSQVQALNETFDTIDQLTQTTGTFANDGEGRIYGITDQAGGGFWGSDPGSTQVFPFTGFDGNFLTASASSNVAGAEPQEIDWTVDITNLTNLAFSGEFAANGIDETPADLMEVQFAIDNAGFTDLIQFDGGPDNISREVGGTGVLTTASQTFYRSIPGTGDTLRLRLRLETTAKNDDMAFDNFIISGISNTPTQVEQVAIEDPSVNINGDTLTYNPTATLADFVEYFVIVDDGAITDTSSNGFDDLTSSAAWNFTTGDYTAPMLVTLNPADDSGSVSTTLTLSITLNEAVQGGTGDITVHQTSDDAVVATFDVTSDISLSTNSVANDTVSFTVSSPLSESTEYYVTVPTGAITDTNANPFIGITDTTTWSFTTGDFTPPSIVTLDVADDATSVDPSAQTDLIIVFNESIQAAGGDIELRLASNDSIIETFDEAAIGDGIETTTVMDDTVVLTLTQPLVDQTGYYVLIDATAIQDLASSQLAFAGISDPTTWNFQTGDFTAPTIVVDGLIPADDVTSVAITTDLTIVFSEAIGAGAGNVTLYESGNPTPIETFDATAIANGITTTTITNDTVILEPSAALSNLTNYYVLVDGNAIQDASANGNPFAGIDDPTGWNFTIALFADTNGDLVVSPADAVFVINRIDDTPTGDNALADVDGDGDIDEDDVDLVIAAIGDSLS